MKHLSQALLWMVFACLVFSSEPALAQIVVEDGDVLPLPIVPTPIETGFAVVTPLQGGGLGLSVSEVFSQVVGQDVFRTSVLPSPLITLTSVLVRVNPNFAVDTGIAIVNPNGGPAVIRMTLNNDLGDTVAVTAFTIDRFQQVGRFVTEYFAGVPAVSRPFNGLLFIDADIPVAVMGLTFTGPSFTSLPVPTQLVAANVPNSATSGIPPNTPASIIAGSVNSVTVPSPVSPQIVVTTSTNTPIVLLGQPSFTAPLTFAPSLPTNNTGLVTAPNLLAPINPPVLPLSPPTATNPLLVPINPPAAPITGFAAPLGTATGVTSPLGTPTPTLETFVSPIVVTPIPEIALGVGGKLAQLLPQVATGGGWVSTIAIANNTDVPQVVRLDFFNSQGGPMVLPFGSTIPALVIPPGGVVTVSTLTQ